MWLWDFDARQQCMALLTYKYATDFMNVAITLLNIEMKETDITQDLIEHTGVFYKKVAYSSFQVMTHLPSSFRHSIQERSRIIINIVALFKVYTHYMH
jgi:hypothetical protein